MRREAADAIALSLLPSRRLTVREWAESHIWIPSTYQCPPQWRGAPYRADGIPWWPQIMASLDEPSVEQIDLLKLSQGGGTQNLLLPAILYYACARGWPCLYASGRVEAVESAFNERLIPLLEQSPALAHLWAKTRVRGTEAYLPNGGLISFQGARADMAFRTRPFGIVALDEVSLFPPSAVEKARSRITHFRPFGGKVLAISAMESKASQVKARVGGQEVAVDPMYAEWLGGDQRELHFQEPCGHGEFQLRLGHAGGGKAETWGVKWDDAHNKDGSVDYELVRQSARYHTPKGSILTDADRVAMLGHGVFRPTNPQAPAWHRSYRVSSLHMPTISMGDTAAQWLQAKRAGPLALRTKTFELLAEPFWQTRIEVSSDELDGIVSPYPRGGTPWDFKSEPDAKPPSPVRIITADVQSAVNGIWLLDTAWLNGEVAICDWSHVYSMHDVDAHAKKVNAKWVGVDANYRERIREVLEACGKLRMIPLVGRDRSMLSVPWQVSTIDPDSGKRASGLSHKRLGLVTWQVDVFRAEAMARLTGKHDPRAHIYREPERDLVSHLTSVEWRDGKWVNKRPRDDLWDAFVMAIVVATLKGLNPSFRPPKAQGDTQAPEQVEEQDVA